MFFRKKKIKEVKVTGLITANHLSDNKKLELARRCHLKCKDSSINWRQKSLYLILHARLMMMLPGHNQVWSGLHTWCSVLEYWRKEFKAELIK